MARYLHLPSRSTALLLAVMSFDAFAESSGEALENEAAPLEEVVVFGRFLQSEAVRALRTPTPIIDVPQSLSIVTSEQIEQRGYASVADMISYIPGVSMSQGEGHRDAVVFRGVRSTADFFIDGIRDDSQYYRSFYNLDQVEILRGPNALLFGRGGAGGVLNRVTKKAKPGEGFQSVRLHGDRLGEFGAQVDVNLGIDETIGLRLNAMTEKLDNHRDHYFGDRVGINPALRIEFSDRFSMDARYEYVNNERFIDRGIPTGADGKPVEAFQSIVFGDAKANVSTLEAHMFSLLTETRLADSTKLNLATSFSDFSKGYSNLYAASYDQEGTPDRVTLDGYVDSTERQNTNIAGTLVTEFSLARAHHTVLAGIEYINTSSDQDRFNAVWSSTQTDKEVFLIQRSMGLVAASGTNAAGVPVAADFSADLNDDTRVEVDVISAYVQDEMEFGERFSVLLGVRFDQFDIDVLNVPAADRRSRRDQEVSPRFGLVYKWADNVSMYASFSETFLPRSGEQYANINGDNNRLDPDTYRNLEAGLKWDIAEGLSFTTALFEIEKRSPQVADNDPATLDVIESEISGFEAQISGAMSDRWSVFAGVSTLEGEQVNRNGGTGLRPRELPERMASLWTEFDASERLTLGGGVTYQSDSFINNSNSATLPSYTRVDATMNYQWSARSSIQVRVENVTDALYFPSSHSTHQVTVAPPLNVRVTFGTRF